MIDSRQMARRKLYIYCDADLDEAVEEAFRRLKEINCDSARRAGTTTRADTDHFHYAAKNKRVLVTHDDDFLQRSYSIMDTHGVIVISRGQNSVAVIEAFLKFLWWAWAPLVRDELKIRSLPGLKVRLSTDGFHWWQRTSDGKIEEDYYRF
jgi:predicted nuclease of predicted toxin-antitoxin system